MQAEGVLSAQALALARLLAGRSLRVVALDLPVAQGAHTGSG